MPRIAIIVRLIKSNSLLTLGALISINAFFIIGIGNNVNAQSAYRVKPAKLSDLTYSCSNDYVKAQIIKILWLETDYHLPITVLDGFNSEMCIGSVSKNTFSWDRGTSKASLDRRTGALTIRPNADGISISLKCKAVD